MTETREVYDVATGKTTKEKRTRRRPNHRRIARLSQAVFVLAMALGTSIILNIVQFFRR